ncbi:nucleoside diphosphate kinase regulator [Mesorhizobium sp. SP-1A]|uniref:nucleoside diphosphate kinase regulator n=1 Tax=Mesorhizobium sp. SP-1A TaxID=3077840 RepID=UPI0028F70A6F|nr:nucleoside diphosphate kinase regulator [Mesorhizobium sp. SP-1A]
MTENARLRRKPSIQISKTDHARLSALAETVAERNPEVSEELFAELDRARIVSDSAVGANVVRMGSTVRFKPDTGEEKTVTLVFPGEADIAQGKISILTPIGTALLGLSAGQSMMWTARDGRRHQLDVLDVAATTAEQESAKERA